MQNAMLIKTARELNDSLKTARLKKKIVGFVPTMGALHNGHLSLVKRAFLENHFVVVSIFVNPTQFNNQEDLKHYPRTLEKDIDLLSSFENLIIFAPNIEEIYPENEVFTPIDLGGLDKVLEGEFRPGHFQGVVHVVHNLFRLIMPNKAYFGMKDFQQLAIIKFMNKHYGFPLEIVACETLREETGLAMSSRNMRLSEHDKGNFSPKELQVKAIEFFKLGKLELEYLAIVDSETLKEADDWMSSNVCCIAAYCGEVRLIDNLLV
jgi:pantoate--beta-alanine ligase